jgi:hypothetical protein
LHYFMNGLDISADLVFATCHATPDWVDTGLPGLADKLI